jgi:hypothetical protein
VEEIGDGTVLQFRISPSNKWKNQSGNWSLGNLLRSMVTEYHSQWEQILSQEEFAYNDSPNKST